MEPKEQQQPAQPDDDVEQGTGTRREPRTENPGSRGPRTPEKSNRGDSEQEVPDEGEEDVGPEEDEDPEEDEE